MPSVRQGSIHLFRLAGVDVSLHWWWFLVAFYQLRGGPGDYSSILWKVFEYLALFLIVLTHEFGHAMACRQVGYLSASQFSREYGRFFGNAPMKDIARLREGGLAGVVAEA